MKILHSTPRHDGFRMPGEFEPQSQVWMAWPERNDIWRNGAKPAQKAYLDVAVAIAEFTPVTMCVSHRQYANCLAQLNGKSNRIRVVEMSTNDAWMRDIGPTFVKNDKGIVRGISWEFNAWGGLYDGSYFPWDFDNVVADKIVAMECQSLYRTPDFVLEGGAIHVDGQGTLITTEMCLLSQGRNPHMSQTEIEKKLSDYLNIDKIIWLKDGIDPEETNGHIDDVACFIRPGEVACIWTDDPHHPFYEAAQTAFDTLSTAIDAKGRRLIVHKLTLTEQPVLLQGAENIDQVSGTVARKNGEICIASYINFLITNGAVIAPQYDDANDALALTQLQAMLPRQQIVGVKTREVVYGGGNIHCITQQQPQA